MSSGSSRAHPPLAGASATSSPLSSLSSSLVSRPLLAESSEETDMQMRRSFAATGFAVALLISLFAGAGSAQADNPVLTGDVALNDAFVISLVDAAGATVKHVDAGTYTLLVHDHSVHHNFHLYGPGVSVATDTNAVGDQTFTITLVDGTYTYVCDPHALTMRGVFTVG